MNGETLIEDALITYKHEDYSISSLYKHYVNFSKYLDLVTEEKKIMPDNDFVPSVMTLIDYNLNDPEKDVYPGAIVNQEYLDNNLAELGNVTFLDYRYYDSQLSLSTAFDTSILIPVRIVAVVEYFPGIYVRSLDNSSESTPTEHIVVDTSDLPLQADYILHAPELQMLLSLNYEAESDQEAIEDYLISQTEDYYEYFGIGNFNFYIDKWVSLQSQESSIEINPSLVYKIGYLIFIVVLIQVALGLPILLTSVRRKEQHFYGMLMSRGFGKKGVFRFILAELFIIYFLAIFGGIAVGLISSTLTLLVGQVSSPYMIGQQFRLFLNPIDLLVVLGSVVGVSLLIFIVGFLSTTRKSISEYLVKF